MIYLGSGSIFPVILFSRDFNKKKKNHGKQKISDWWVTHKNSG